MKRNFTVIFLANAFSLASGVVTSLLTAWALGPEGRGDLAIIALYPNIVALAVGLGMAHATRYFVAREPRKISMFFSNAVCFAITAGLIAFVAAEYVIPQIVGTRSPEVMWLVRAYLINIPLALMYDLMAGMLEGSRRFKWVASARIVFFAVQSIGYLVLWLTGSLTVLTAAATMVIAQLSTTFIAFATVLSVLKPAWRPSYRALKRTARFGIKYYFGVVTSFTTLRLDQMMLGAMGTSVEMGLYVIAVRISEVMTVLASSVSDVMMPEVAATNGAKKSIALLTRSLRLTVYIYLLMLVPVLVGTPLVLQYGFGPGFVAAAPALELLFLASLAWSAGAIINSGLNGLGHPGLSTFSRLTSAIVTVATLLVWLPRYSIIGAALSSLVGYSAMFAVALFWLVRKQKLRLRDIFRPRLTDIPMNALKSILPASLQASANPAQLLVPRLFEKQAAEHPDRIAVTSKAGHLTYGELNEKANQLARFLKDRGVGPETLVPISVDRSADMAIGILGILKAGAAFVPIDPGYPQDRIDFMLGDTKAQFLVTQSTLIADCSAERICLDSDWDKIAQFSTDNPDRGADGDDLAYVIYTSGSTGKPKGVMLTHANLSHYVHALQKEFALTGDDTYLHLASIGFSSSRRHLLLPLCWGAGVVIADEFQRLDPIPLFELVKAEKITVFDSVPSFQRHCINELRELDENDRSQLLDNDLRLIVSASEPLYSDIPRVWMHDFGHPAEHVHMMGQTETSGIVCLGKISKADVDGDTRPVPIGSPIADMHIELLDENFDPVPSGEAGEMYVSGAGVGRGYLNRSDLDETKFAAIALNGDEPTKFVRTGDFARVLPDGRLECLGRNDFQVKIRGNRIELGEIESVLLRHEGVRGCVVVGSQVRPGETRLVGYVASSAESGILRAELRDLAAGSLPEYMRPQTFVVIDTLPLTPNGKIDRKALPAVDIDLETSPDEPVDTADLEGLVKRVWADILEVPEIAAKDDFFALGGHSLMASRMISRLRSKLGIGLPIRAIFDAPVFDAFLRTVTECVESSTPDDGPGSVARPDRIPLSFAQRRVWFLGELDQDLTAYNECEILKLSGNLDVAALQTALEKLVDRHEVLRTVFAVEGGEPYQIILDSVAVDLSVRSCADANDAFAAARSLCDEAIDLTAGPLFRFTLVQTSEDEHFLILVLHHAVTDLWSVGLLIRDLDEFYKAAAARRDHALPPLPIQYADYASWQHAWLSTPDYDRQMAFWRDHLAEAPGLLEMPTDKPRPPVQRYEGSQATMLMNGDSPRQLRELCERVGVTPYMVLMACWQMLLYRYSGQDQVVVGTPIAGRNRSETEDLIGFFVNTLAVRGDLSGDPTFIELLERTRERCLGAFSNQDLPFEKLVEEINPGRDLSYTPIFQALFTLQNAPKFSESIGGLPVERLRLPKDTAKFDLSLDIYERTTDFELQLEFNTDLYEPETADRMLRHFSTMLHSAFGDPDQRLSNIQMLTDTELAQMLGEWNSAAIEIPDLCVHELIEAHAASKPDSIAVVWNDASITYADLNARADQLSRFLIKKGVGTGAIVGVHLGKSIDLIVTILAIMKSGAAYLPLDPNYPSDRLQFMVDEAQVAVLVTDEADRDSATRLGWSEIVFVDTDRAAIDLESTDKPDVTVSPADLVYVTFTSGSTGRAKGVMIEHRNVVNVFAGWDKEYGLSSVTNHLQMASFSFDVFAGDLTRALCSGGKLVLCPTESLLEPAALENIIRKENIEIAEFVPSVVRPLMHHLEKEGRTLDTFKVIIVGSDTWQLDEYRRLQALVQPGSRVINSYGMTEATIDSTYFECADLENGGAEIVPIGKPFPNTEIYIIDTLGNPVPVGVPGELYQAGPGVGRGYLNAPEMTETKFVELELPGANGPVTKRLYRSGDLACYRADGTIEIIGRADNQVKLRGYRIELGEIESVLARHPAVSECVVILRHDLPGDKRLVAYFKSRVEDPDIVEMRTHLRGLLPEYMVPAAFVTVTDWKLTPNGKIDRKQLPVPDGDAVAIANDYIEPVTPVEKALAKIWTDLLRIERVGVSDNFFELGGHSLLATQVVSRMRDRLGCEVALRVIFESPTIAEIAGLLDADVSANGGTLEDLLNEIEDPDELESLLDELESVTDEEADRALAEMNRNYSIANIGSK